MRIGMVGLGKMGANMTKRLIDHGHEVVGFDLGAEAREVVAGYGADTAATLDEMASKLSSPRVAWVMVPAGKPTDDTIARLGELFSSGDVVIEGGNSYYKESVPYANALAAKGIGYVDAGTSGGVWGLANGYCLMVGGDDEHVKIVEPIFTALAPEGGYAHVGPVGAGHFVKMVHNGIEYGLMQAYAEGFDLMRSAKEFDLDLHEIASIWRYGSVVRSWLLELTELALRPDAGIEDIEPYVVDTGEGRWTLQEAIERSVPLPVLAVSLFERFASRDQEKFADRLLAALRNQFGGHAVERLSDVHGAEGGAPGDGAAGAGAGGAGGGGASSGGAAAGGAGAGGAGAGGAAAGGGGAGGSGAS